MDESFADIFNNQDNIGKSADPSVLYYPEPYCDTLEKMKTACFETRYFWINFYLKYLFLLKFFISVFWSCLEYLEITMRPWLKVWLKIN